MLHDCTAEMGPRASAWRTQCAYISRTNANGRPGALDGPATVKRWRPGGVSRPRLSLGGGGRSHRKVSFNYVLESTDSAAKCVLAADEFPNPAP